MWCDGAVRRCGVIWRMSGDVPVIGKRYSRFAGARRRASRDSPTIPFMVTPRISYAHLLAEPNPKHVESLLKFFEAGRSKRGTGGLGVEIEHLPVHDADDTAVSYYEPNGIEAFLKRLAPYYDESKESWVKGNLV